jgi:hypothetical protein
MKTLKKQSGLTMWGWLVVLSMVGLLGYAFMALYTPISNYVIFESIVNDKLIANTALRDAKKKEIEMVMIKNTGFNKVPFDLNKETFIIKDVRGKGKTAKILFDQRVDFIWEIDFVVSYDKTVEVGSGVK